MAPTSNQGPAAKRKLANARKLFDEFKELSGKPYWNGSAEQERLLDRARALARELDVNSTFPDYEATAIMLLDKIADKEKITFRYKNEAPGPTRLTANEFARPHEEQRGHPKPRPKNISMIDEDCGEADETDE